MLPIMTKRTERDAREYLRPAEAAQRLMVTTKTLQRMEARGQLAAYRSPGGHRRFLEKDVAALEPAPP